MDFEERTSETIQQDIEQRRLEIEQEIEEKRRKVEQEIALKRLEMEKKLAQQREEIERKHAEQIEILNRQIDAREMAARIEAEFNDAKEQVASGIPFEDQQEVNLDSSLTADADELMLQAEKQFFQDSQNEDDCLEKENDDKEVVLSNDVTLEINDEENKEDERKDEQVISKEESGVISFVKNIFKTKSDEEIAAAIAAEDARRVRQEEQEAAEQETQEEQTDKESFEIERNNDNDFHENDEKIENIIVEQENVVENNVDEKTTSDVVKGTVLSSNVKDLEAKTENIIASQIGKNDVKIENLSEVVEDKTTEETEEKENLYKQETSAITNTLLEKYVKKDDNKEISENVENVKKKDDEKKEERRRKRIKRIAWGRLFFIIISIFLVLAIFFFGTLFVCRFLLKQGRSAVVYPNKQTIVATNTGKDEKNKITEPILEERINILLLGTDYGDSDADKTDPKRTDAMLLLSFNPREDRVSVLSIPRDTKVILPGHRDPEKINAAYAYGGVMMAKQTVANLLGVPITHYCLADWKAFTEIVDLIGGVDILVEHDMKYDDPYADLHIDLKKGFQHLNGKEAGQYVRYRSDELGDIGRTQRQQKFIKAAAEQMFTVGNVVKIPAMIKTVSDYMQTDMNTLTMLKALNSVKIFGKDGIRTGTLYGETLDEGDVSYWNVDEASVKRTLDELKISVN